MKALLLPIDGKKTVANGSRSRSSSANVSTNAIILAPDRPLAPAPSQNRLHLAEVIREALNIPGLEFEKLKSVLLESYSSDVCAVR